MNDRKFGTYLAHAIETRSIEEIRGALKGIMDADPAFLTGRFDDAAAYLDSIGLDVYEPHDPSFAMQETGWDKRYFSLVMTHLIYNFSAERVAHLRAVGAKVMADDPIYHTPAPPKAEPEKEAPPIPKSKANTGKNRLFPAVPVLAASVILLVLILLWILLK